MNVNLPIFLPLTLGLVAFSIAFFKYPRYAIAGMIIAKPIIDVSWDYFIFLNINFLKLYAGLFVILGVIYIFYQRPKILRHPISIVWLIFLGLSIVSIFIISDAHLLFGKVNYFLRILTGFVALIMFAHLYDFKKDKKFVLSIFIIAGIFPILLWLIPVLIGNPIISNDPLRRIMGPYQNFWNFNFYAIQTLIFCLAYLASTNKCEPKMNTSKKAKNFSFSYHLTSLFKQITQLLNNLITKHSRTFKLVKRVVPYLMILISVAMIYKCYSKAGWISVVAIFLIWFTVQRKFISASLVALITVIILFVNPFSSDFQKTFRNEIDYYLHRPMSKQGVFRGRLSRWEKALQYYNSLPVINKTFGVGTNELGIENNYLKILVDKGIIGILIYISILGLTICYLIVSYTRTSDPIVLAGIMAVVILMIMSVGANPTLIPNFQWFVWGPVGFVFGSRKRILGEHPSEFEKRR